MSCRHSYATMKLWYRGTDLVCSALHCERCDEVMPLGPSNDSPPEVQIEIRAAEIAWLESAHTVRMAMHEGDLDGAEWACWIEHRFDSAKVPEQAGEWAGWLARQIARGEP